MFLEGLFRCLAAGKKSKIAQYNYQYIRLLQLL